MSKNNQDYTIIKKKVIFSNIEDYNYRIRNYNRIPVHFLVIDEKTNFAIATFQWKKPPKPKYFNLENQQPKRGEYVLVLQEDGENEKLMEYFSRTTEVSEKHIEGFAKLNDGSEDILFLPTFGGIQVRAFKTIEAEYKTMMKTIGQLENAAEKKINCYRCPECLMVLKTIDVDRGTTPFMINCDHCNRGMMKSTFYKDIVPEMGVTKEWYRPTLAALRKYNNDGNKDALIDHVLNGGLELRDHVQNREKMKVLECPVCKKSDLIRHDVLTVEKVLVTFQCVNDGILFTDE